MIQCSGLYKKYNRKVALENVSVTLEKGKIYAFLGPNGSGKTTFMKILANLTEQSKGTVLFDGESLTVKSRAKIAYLPTESHAYPFMTVEDFGKYYAYFFKDFDRNRFKDWVERMQIPFQTPFKVLSSGMDKKVRVAATLARSAELLILDEPFNGWIFLQEKRLRR